MHRPFLIFGLFKSSLLQQEYKTILYFAEIPAISFMISDCFFNLSLKKQSDIINEMAGIYDIGLFF